MSGSGLLLPAAVAVLLTALSGCDPAPDEDPYDGYSGASWNTSQDTAFFGVEELTHLHGLGENEVLEMSGAPDCETELILHAGETLNEFYIEINNTYRPEDPTIEGRVIRHLQWDRYGYSEAVFLHRPDPEGDWIVLESVKWSNDVEF